MIRLDGMRKMITDLLDMTRIESGEKQREFTDIDIISIARNSIETAMPEASARNIVINLKNNLPINIYADKGEIEIILNNLITNAVKYNRDSGKVDITISKENGLISITVSDGGGCNRQEVICRDTGSD